MLNLIFWAGQVVCVAGMAYGAYLSLTYGAHRVAEESERMDDARLHHPAMA